MCYSHGLAGSALNQQKVASQSHSPPRLEGVFLDCKMHEHFGHSGSSTCVEGNYVHPTR